MQRVVSLNLRRYSRDPVPGTRYLSKFSSKFSFFDRKSDFTYDMPGNSNCTSNRQLYVIDRLLLHVVDLTGLSPHNHGFILVRGRGLPGWSMTQLEASGHGWTYCSYCPIPAGSDFRTQRAARRRPPGKYRHLQWRLYEGSTDRLCMVKPYQ
jgi:hypothetical protein